MNMESEGGADPSGETDACIISPDTANAPSGMSSAVINTNEAVSDSSNIVSEKRVAVESSDFPEGLGALEYQRLGLGLFGMGVLFAILVIWGVLFAPVWCHGTSVEIAASGGLHIMFLLLFLAASWILPKKLPQRKRLLWRVTTALLLSPFWCMAISLKNVPTYQVSDFIWAQSDISCLLVMICFVEVVWIHASICRKAMISFGWSKLYSWLYYLVVAIVLCYSLVVWLYATGGGHAARLLPILFNCSEGGNPAYFQPFGILFLSALGSFIIGRQYLKKSEKEAVQDDDINHGAGCPECK